MANIPKVITDLAAEALSDHNNGYVTEKMKGRLRNILIYVRQVLGELKTEKDIEGLNIGDLPVEIVDLAFDYLRPLEASIYLTEKEDARKQLVEIKDYITSIVR